MSEADPAAERTPHGRRVRIASPAVALALGIVLAALAAAVIPLSLLARQSPAVNGGEALGAVLLPAPVGVFLAWRVPRNPIGWLFMAISFCLLLSVDSGFYAAISYRVGDHLPLAAVALFSYQLWGPALTLFLLVILGLPGRAPAVAVGAWILLAFLAVLIGLAVALIAAVASAVAHHQVRLDSFDGLVAIDQPTGWFALVQTVFLVLAAPFAVGGVGTPGGGVAALVR